MEETSEQREQRVARHREQDRKHQATARAEESEQKREQRLVKVNDVAVVKKSERKELQKQDVVIGDETGSCRLVLWEEDVGSLEEVKSYHLLDVVVRRYGTAKYLSYSSRCSKTLVEDMKDINDKDISGEDCESG